MEVGERGRRHTYIAALSPSEDFCIKVGSDESHFNVSLIVRDKVTRQCPQTTTFEEKGEPKRIFELVTVHSLLQPLDSFTQVFFFFV